MVKYLSLFSGVEAASVAWEPMGWEPMAFAEIEPFPSAVLAARFPTVPNLGDVTVVDWEAWRAENGSPDVIVAGSPCQAFSVAGKRLSLEDARGNLSLFTAELVRYLNPGVFVWENVPGALSTSDNAFGCLLGDIVGADAPIVPPGKRWTGAGMVTGPERVAAWRILDAQYFGVAQRRRRIFLVACPLGGADPAEILFELESVYRDTPPSRQPRKGAAPEPESGFRSGCDTYNGAMTGEVGATVSTNSGMSTGMGPRVLEQSFRSSSLGNYEPSDVGGVVRAQGISGDMPVVCTIASKQQAMTTEYDLASTLGSSDYKEPQAVCEWWNGEQVTDTITEHSDQRRMPDKGNMCGVVEAYRKSARAQTKDGYETWVADGVATSTVRRLLPVECERLQGFPDNWTQVPRLLTRHRPSCALLSDNFDDIGAGCDCGAKPRLRPAEDCPDSHRYKAMGNSMAVPVMRWLGARIDAALNGTPFVYGIPEACRGEIEGRSETHAASEPTVMAPAFSKRPGQQIANRSDGLCYAVTAGQPPSVCG